MPFSELAERINNGYRTLDQLQKSPNCKYNNGPQNFYQQQQYQFSPEIIQQPNDARQSLALNFNAEPSEVQQQNQFFSLAADASENLGQSQLYRKQRQRSFGIQNGGNQRGNYIYPSYPRIPPYPQSGYPQSGYPQPNYPQPSYPQPSYPTQPNGSYPIPPLPPSSYPVQPPYALPPTTGLPTTTGTSSAATDVLSVSVFVGSMALLLPALCLTN